MSGIIQADGALTVTEPRLSPASSLATATRLVAPRPAVALSAVSKVYGSRSHRVAALDNIDLSVAPGEFVCLDRKSVV